MSHDVLFSGGVLAAPEPLVYGLVDPREPGVIRYVGSTCRPMARYVSHCTTLTYRPGGRRRIDWVRSITEEGCQPTMILLERVTGDGAELRDVERRWIAKVRAAGQADLNGIDRATAARTGAAVSRAHRQRKLFERKAKGGKA